MRLIMLKLLRPAAGYNVTYNVSEELQVPILAQKEEHAEEESCLCRKDEWTGWQGGR